MMLSALSFGVVRVHLHRSVCFCSHSLHPLGTSCEMEIKTGVQSEPYDGGAEHAKQIFK